MNHSPTSKLPNHSISPLEQNSLKEFIDFLSPNPLPFFCLELFLIKILLLPLHLKGSCWGHWDDLHLEKSHGQVSVYLTCSSSTWPATSPAFHATYSLCGFQDTVLSWFLFLSCRLLFVSSIFWFFLPASISQSILYPHVLFLMASSSLIA